LPANRTTAAIIIICCIEGLQPKMLHKQALQTHHTANSEDSCFWYLFIVFIRA
jgi:hypothetical protein